MRLKPLRSPLLASLICATTMVGCSLGSLFGNNDKPLKLVFLTQPDSVKTGVVIAPSITVAIEDSEGHTISSATDTVTISLESNQYMNGTLSGTLSAQAQNGVATFSDLSVDKTWSYAGPCCGYTVRASAKGFAPVTSSRFYADPGPANKLVFTTQPKTFVVGTQITVIVEILDAAGHSLRNSAASVSLALGSNAAGATLSGAPPTQLTIYGSAIYTISVDRPGAGFTLTATAYGLTSATSIPFDVTAKP